MRKNKIQIKSIWGNLLFKYEKEDNSIKDTLMEALKQKSDLSGADLSGAKIDNPEFLKKWFWIIPEQGSFEAWKKLADNCIAKLLIPAKAKRTCNLKNRKCRAEYVKVLGIWDEKGNKVGRCFNKTHDTKLVYKVGRIVRADSFDDSILEDCSHGIHFFVTRQEAEEW